MHRGPSRRRLILATLATLGVWIAAWATGLTGRFTSETIRALLAGDGLQGVAAFTILFAAAQLLRVPSPVFVAAAVAVYGLTLGVFIGLLGALVSATVSFSVLRGLTGQALADVQLPILGRLLSAIDDRPVMTVALLRLVFQTAPPLNYALAMTAVRWRDHLIGSFVGLPLPVTVMAFFFDWLARRAIDH
ncbi:MAG TPA: VTT domain-containing protein [Vicinamibacterales bacterium]|nr:VTT domain-containing protein [Vicinamibacterales bacterium]